MNPTWKIHGIECSVVIYDVRVPGLTERGGDPMPLLASNSSKRELPIRIVNHHEDAITPRGIAGKHVLEIQNPAEPIHRVGLRWLVLPPRERGVVERKVIPLEVAGVVVEDRAYLLDGGDGRESTSCSPVAGLRRWSSERASAVTSQPWDDPTMLRSAMGGSGRGTVYVLSSARLYSSAAREPLATTVE